MRAVLVAWALLLALGLMPLSAAAQEVVTTVTIEGRVENGTEGEVVPDGMVVTLEVFQQGTSVETVGTVADANGVFSFDGVAGGEGFGYIIVTSYGGVEYSFESDYPLAADTTTLVVYETTSLSENVRVVAHTLVVNSLDSNERMITAVELVGLENSGDRTFVADLSQPGEMQLLRFSLPPGAVDLDVGSNLSPGQLLQVDLGFAVNSPIPPGRHEVTFAYSAPYHGGTLDFAQAFPFGADVYRVLVLQGLANVSGDGLMEMAPLSFDESVYQQLEARDLDAGARIELRFTGLSQPSLWQRFSDALSGDSFVVAALPAAFALGLVALIGYAFLTRGARSTMAASPVGVEHGAGLIEQMARLDDRFQRRELGTEEYLDRRRETKARALGADNLLINPDDGPGQGIEVAALQSAEEEDGVAER